MAYFFRVRVAYPQQKRKEIHMNRIVIELCPEDRARIDALAGALRSCCAPVTTTVTAPAESFLDKELHTPEAPAEVPDPPAAEPVSLAEFQKVLSERWAQSTEMKARVRALLNEYAESASAVPEDKRAEVLDRLREL